MSSRSPLGPAGSWRRRCVTRSSPTRSSTRPWVLARSPLRSRSLGSEPGRCSHSGVYNVLKGAGLSRRVTRLAAAESLAASEGGPITERMLRDLRAIERATVHIGSDTPGEQVFFDTMFVGNLKGVGKIWQYSPVDGSCSFAFARLLAGEKSAAKAAAFLELDVAPIYAEAGIELREVIVDGGPEFKREFTASCSRLGVSRHQLPARSPNLNAFVERFQGSVLHLHYRTAFRYRFYTDAGDIDADLQGWMRFYNFERPHRGYRTKGRRPAEIFLCEPPRSARAERMGPR